jgi:hypothetical protein
MCVLNAQCFYRIEAELRHYLVYSSGILDKMLIALKLNEKRNLKGLAAGVFSVWLSVLYLLIALLWQQMLCLALGLFKPRVL